MADVSNFFATLSQWNCHIGFDPDSLTPQEEAVAVGLTAQDWDDYEALMMDEEVPAKDKENWTCWMKNHLTECVSCPACPEEDPFE